MALLGSPAAPQWVTQERFRWSVEAWSRSEAILWLLYRRLDEVGLQEGLTELTDGDEQEDRPAPGAARRKLRQTKVAPLLDQIARYERLAIAQRKSLGLTPDAFASMARDVALAGQAQTSALERLSAQGASIRQRRESELRVIGGDGPG